LDNAENSAHRELSKSDFAADYADLLTLPNLPNCARITTQCLAESR
jgi:hypothetical protein